MVDNALLLTGKNTQRRTPQNTLSSDPDYVVNDSVRRGQIIFDKIFIHISKTSSRYVYSQVRSMVAVYERTDNECSCIVLFMSRFLQTNGLATALRVVLQLHEMKSLGVCETHCQVELQIMSDTIRQVQSLKDTSITTVLAGPYLWWQDHRHHTKQASKH